MKAVLDRKPAPLQAEGGRPKSGVIQFGGAQGLRILAIEYRELPK